MNSVGSTNVSSLTAKKMLPSLTIQTLVTAQPGLGLRRWFSAALEALVSATTAGNLGEWRIVIGVVATTKEEVKELADFARQAQVAGGEVVTESIGALGYPQAHDRLLHSGEGSHVLVIDSDVVVLPSTLVRLLDGIAQGGVDALHARIVPLSADSADWFGCALYSRRKLDSSGGFVGLGSHDRGVTSVRCPQAVVVRDRRVFSEQPAVFDASETEGALLEQAMDFPALTDAREALIAALTVPVKPMVSIVMRTQLRRPEALRDALVCLAGQTDGRFEILLVVHDADTAAALEILSDQPEWLRHRARVVAAQGGTRSVPINVGIAAATGTHIAFLDDDDLVFAHWVASFLLAADRHPRRLLRALTAVQRVGLTTWSNGTVGHEHGSELLTPYPSSYNFADHLRVNMTPFMAFAFPRGFFNVFGGADESLEVCEDWDISLRAALVLGVGDIPLVTSIYRRWSTGGDSYSAHGEAIWQRDMSIVRSKLAAAPVILPPGGAGLLARYSTMDDSESKLSDVYASTSWRMTSPIRYVADRAGNFRKAITSLLRRPTF
jgi:hypothetical protein